MVLNRNKQSRRNKRGGKRSRKFSLRNRNRNRNRKMNKRNKSMRKKQCGGRRNRNKKQTRKQMKKQRRSRSRSRYQYGGAGCGSRNTALVGREWNAQDGGNYHPLYDTRGITPQAGMHPNDISHPVHHGQKGGNIIPRDILNLGRSVGKGFSDIYAGYRGVPPATSPLPNKDQGIDERTKYIGGLPVDMSKRLSQADRIVSRI